ncbi:hypothetical protein EVAR_22344_1 [Eumeta japonica]|uniref:Uncharacterized protein n=1 Tax=Eumeta variegata TaxID=151549 RepID=A0A4C1VIC0_EUMVA|nr:hypothetical protein EVAR_22344_1 [Eumeta japonica]
MRKWLFTQSEVRQNCTRKHGRRKWKYPKTVVATLRMCGSERSTTPYPRVWTIDSCVAIIIYGRISEFRLVFLKSYGEVKLAFGIKLSDCLRTALAPHGKHMGFTLLQYESGPARSVNRDTLTEC